MRHRQTTTRADPAQTANPRSLARIKRGCSCTVCAAASVSPPRWPVDGVQQADEVLLHGTVVLMRDHDVRVALRARLMGEHAAAHDQTLLVDELGLCGAARVDVAAVNGSLTGYELKSARDKLDRLPNQVVTYGRVLDYAYLVVASTHLDRARPMLPPWWGILVAREADGGVVLSHQRRARGNPAVDAGSLAQLLWREEALAILTRHGLDAGVRGKPRHVLWDRLATDLRLDELRDEVRATLKARRGWRENPAQRGSAATWLPSNTTPRFLARRLR